MIEGYYRKFSDLPCSIQILLLLVEVLCCFKLGGKKGSGILGDHYPLYFLPGIYEMLLSLEDSENMSNENKEE